MIRQNILITGASCGIGHALACALAQCGARVVGSGRRATTRYSSSTEGHYANMCYVCADLTDREACRRLVAEAVKHNGPLDMLINCAGQYARKSLAAWDAHAEQLFQINTFVPARMMAEAVPYFRDAGGVIVNITSEITRRPAGRAAYAATKAALDALTEAAAIEYTPHHVLAICPGPVATQMDVSRTARTTPEALAALLAPWLYNFNEPSGFYRQTILVREFRSA